MISENLHSDSKNHENTNNEIEFFEEEYIGLPLDELLIRLESISTDLMRVPFQRSLIN